MYNKILIRYGELSTKGKNKMTFVRKLEKNMKDYQGLKPFVIFDRMFLDYSEEALEKLNYVYGIQSFSPVIEVETNLESLEEAILKIVEKFGAQNDGLTFKIASKRHWKKFDKTSFELNYHFGGVVLNATDWSVDVKNPDVKIEIEIREKTSYIFFKRHMGLGGYPAGINGKVLHLISGGIDSPIAALEMIKRGIHIDFLNFITPPMTDEKTLEKVETIIKKINLYQGPSKLFRSNYSDLMNYIGMTSKQGYKINLMRRSFYRIATAIAKKHKYLALSNGENLGQVASQTPESIHTIQAVSDLVIYRPLLTADKIETINKAREIGMYELSIIKANETCELFAPKAPVIKPHIKVSKELEKELNEIPKLEEENINFNINIINFD